MAEHGPTVTFTGNVAAKLREACDLTGGDLDTVLMSALSLYVGTGDGSEWGVQRDPGTGVYRLWLQRQVTP